MSRPQQRNGSELHDRVGHTHISDREGLAMVLCLLDGWTVDEVAFAFEHTPQTVRRWATAERDRIEAILDEFGVRVDA